MPELVLDAADRVALRRELHEIGLPTVSAATGDAPLRAPLGQREAYFVTTLSAAATIRGGG